MGALKVARLVAALFVVCLWVDLPKATGADKLNVLFLMSDDMRPDLGCYGHPLVKSPSLDALARTGVRFDRAYCQYPLCNPSRTSMLNGRYPTTTGVLNNLGWFGAAHPDWKSLPRHFKDNGYVSLRTGKIFHGGIDDAAAWTEGGEERKFEGGVAPNRNISQADRVRQSDQIVKLKGNGESHADFKTAERAIEYLNRYKDQPFFLACGFTKPHSPPTAPERFFEMYDASKIPLPPNFGPNPQVPAGYPDRALTPNGDLFIKRDASEQQAREMIQAYWASISWADWNIGRVLAELDRLGLRDNTVVLFWGDHGYHLGEFGKWSKHGSLFEVGTRVPLIISAPGKAGNGSTATSPVQSLDIYPTLCELCGLSKTDGLEGHSLVPLLSDTNAKWEHPAMSVFGSDKQLGVAVRTKDYRYVEYDGGKSGVMLFNTADDPHELKNLANDPAHDKVREELSRHARSLWDRQ